MEEKKMIEYDEHLESMSYWMDKNAKLEEEIEFLRAIIKKLVS